MQMPSLDVDSRAFSELVGGLWHRIYANRRGSEQYVFVFQNNVDSSDIRVLRNDVRASQGQKMQVPGIGRMTCHLCMDDPALSGLQDILGKYSSFEVLRYRPGKRITVAAFDERFGPVVIKLVAAGIENICARLREVAKASPEFDFRVSELVETFPQENVFVQRRLSGHAIGGENRHFDRELVVKIASATRSLHSSSAAFSETFDVAAQSNRTKRYIRLIRTRMPALAGLIDRIDRELEELGRQIGRHSTRLVPVHGSLHSHQWLVDGDQLALVDFDRAAMGYAELDIATFLAEFDYESPTIGAEVNGVFLREFLDCDPLILSFYRAHKHLAKAFKASKQPESEIALAKTHRNLNRTFRLLEH